MSALPAPPLPTLHAGFAPVGVQQDQKAAEHLEEHLAFAETATAFTETATAGTARSQFTYDLGKIYL